MKNLIYLACITLAIYCQPALAMEALKTKQQSIMKVQNTHLRHIDVAKLAKDFFAEIEKLRAEEFNKAHSWIDRGEYAFNTIQTLKTILAEIESDIATSRGKVIDERVNKLIEKKVRVETYIKEFARAGITGYKNSYIEGKNSDYNNQSRQNNQHFNKIVDALTRDADVGENGYFGTTYGGYEIKATDNYANTK